MTKELIPYSEPCLLECRGRRGVTNHNSISRRARRWTPFQAGGTSPDISIPEVRRGDAANGAEIDRLHIAKVRLEADEARREANLLIEVTRQIEKRRIYFALPIRVAL